MLKLKLAPLFPPGRRRQRVRRAEQLGGRGVVCSNRFVLALLVFQNLAELAMKARPAESLRIRRIRQSGKIGGAGVIMLCEDAVDVTQLLAEDGRQRAPAGVIGDCWQQREGLFEISARIAMGEDGLRCRRGTVIEAKRKFGLPSLCVVCGDLSTSRIERVCVQGCHCLGDT